MNTLDDFERYILGETAEEVALHDLTSNQVLSARMIEQARRHLDLFTFDLDPPVYDRPVIIEEIKRLALSGGGARIRILLQNNEPVVKQGHRLLEVARRLSSSFDIRMPPPDFMNHPESFLLVDDCGYIHRKVSTSLEATADFNSPYRVERLREFFESVWESSEPDVELRRLYI